MEDSSISQRIREIKSKMDHVRRRLRMETSVDDPVKLKKSLQKLEVIAVLLAQLNCECSQRATTPVAESGWHVITPHTRHSYRNWSLNSPKRRWP